jgi:mannose-6-phosphate isomerase
VQVHPSDRQPSHLPAGELGKTEAWVVLQAGPAGRVYAGLNSFTTKEALHRAVVEGTIADHLASFAPQPGDVVFVEAGTVHSLSDLVVFEVQENSDVTFRLYDWGRIDPKTGRPGACRSIKPWLASTFPKVLWRLVRLWWRPWNRCSKSDC